MTQPSQTRKTSFRGKELELQDLLPSQELLMVKIARDLRRAANEGNNNILEAAKLLDILETALGGSHHQAPAGPEGGHLPLGWQGGGDREA
jgi:hypothetical protein